MKSYFIISVLSLSLFTLMFPSVQAQENEVVFGQELMTEEEITEHRELVRQLRSEEERQMFHNAHHNAMQARASERGMTLSDQPKARAKNSDKGKGQGMVEGKSGIESRLDNLEQCIEHLSQMKRPTGHRRANASSDGDSIMSGHHRRQNKPHEMKGAMHHRNHRMHAEMKSRITKVEDRLAVIQTMLERLLNR